jgi:hypothetical protein
VKRVALLLVGVCLLVAAGNRVAEHFGAMTCDCADDCWCHRRGLSLFRWVFPWRHHPRHTAEEKAGLDPTRA